MRDDERASEALVTIDGGWPGPGAYPADGGEARGAAELRSRQPHCRIPTSALWKRESFSNCTYIKLEITVDISGWQLLLASMNN